MIHLSQAYIKSAHDLILEHTLTILKEEQGYISDKDLLCNTKGELFPGKIDAIIDNLLYPKDQNYLVCHRVSKFMFDVCTLHPYIEGNKRTAYFVSSVILAVNGLDFHIPSRKVDVFLRKVAAGIVNQKNTEKWVRKNCKIRFIRAAPLFILQAISILFHRRRDIPLEELGLKDNFLKDLTIYFVRRIHPKKRKTSMPRL